MSTFKHLLQRAIHTITILALTLMGVSLLGRLWWPFDVLTHFLPHYFVVLTVAGLIYLLSKRTRAATLCLLLAGYASLWLWPYYLLPTPQPAGEPQLTLLISNVYQHADTIGRLQMLVAEREPDIILLMEMIPGAQYDQVQQLAAEYPYFLHEPRLSGNAIFSKHPIQSVSPHYWDGGRVDVKLIIEVNNTPVTIFATHARAAKSDWEARDRNLQLAHMGRYFAEHNDHIIITGDLNVTPWSGYYQRFIRRTNLVDQRLGRGGMPTWPLLPSPLSLLMVPFDHLLTTPDIAVHSYELADSIGSDHYPLWAAVSIN